MYSHNWYRAIGRWKSNLKMFLPSASYWCRDGGNKSNFIKRRVPAETTVHLAARLLHLRCSYLSLQLSSASMCNVL